MFRLIKLIIAYSFLYTTLVSCQDPIPQAADCVLPEKSNSEEADVQICSVPEPEELASLELNVELKDFNTKQEEKMRDALAQLKIILNSKVFKERVLNHQYEDESTFVDNNGLSNKEIYEKIMEAAEVLDPEVDQEMDLKITLYYANNSTVGYTYPDSDRVWVNNKFFAGYSLAKVAANVVHEWTHKLGFGHDFRRTTRRNFSVPYGVGTIVRELIEKMGESQSPDTE